MIRRVHPQDLEQVNSIANRVLHETYSMELFTHLFETHPGSFFVAEEEGMVHGFALAVPLSARVMRLLMIGVVPERENLGIGGSLLEACLSYARMRMMGEMVLEVGTMNKRAIDFYSRKGFSITSRIQEYYNDRSDAFVMKCFIPS